MGGEIFFWKNERKIIFNESSEDFRVVGKAAGHDNGPVDETLTGVVDNFEVMVGGVAFSGTKFFGVVNGCKNRIIQGVGVAARIANEFRINNRVDGGKNKPEGVSFASRQISGEQIGFVSQTFCGAFYKLLGFLFDARVGAKGSGGGGDIHITKAGDINQIHFHR